MKRLAALIFALALVLPACGIGPDAGKAADSPAGSDGSNPALEASGEDFTDIDEPLFPRMSREPSHLIVYDAHGQSLAMRYMLTSLQGVVNRTEPRIFYLITPFGWPDGSEHEDFWLERIVENFGVTTETIDDPWALLERFADELAGCVVYDPDMVQTINVGTTLAGLRDAVLVHPSLLDQATALGLPVVEDLRGRFESNVEMYTWAYQTLWPQCNHDILAYIDTIFPTLRDYLVAQKIFVLGLDPHRADEVALLDTIYRETPMNISVLGWVVDEVIGVRLLSRNGKFHNPSDLVPNISVHAGLAPKEYEPIERPDPPPLENRIYVAFAITDGDNLTFIHREMLNQWEDPARGSIPLGWELNTTLQDLSPATYHYYRSTISSNDHFIGPVVGIGYMYPKLYPDLPGFLNLTRRAYERHDYYTIWLINDDLTMPDSIATAYSAALDIEGIFVDYWPNADRGWHLASDGTPMVHSRYVYLVGTEQLENILANAAVDKLYHYPNDPTFVYINVNGWGTPPSLVAGIVEGLDDRYRVVRPDHMLLLIGEALQ